MPSNDSPHATVVMGAGPAGLSAAYELSRAGRAVNVLEQDGEHVGGLSRTIDYKGFLFDVGGHRFFSKNAEIEELWTRVLGDRMERRKRLSRIYYDGRFFKYPLDPMDALAGLGAREALACMLSFAAARCAPARPIRSFEDWVVHAFGRRLYEIFFRTYTEKVWGISCRDISADWATQRIKGLSIPSLIRTAFGRRSNGNGSVIKTLVDEFRYPARGPGELWNEVAALVRGAGGRILLGERVVALRRERGRALAVVARGSDGERSFAGDHFVSTVPIRDLVGALEPAAPADVGAAAGALRYRDFLMVAVVLERAEVFPDQWIYIHDPRVSVGRIQNFKNWSRTMVPDPRFTLLGLEYFCSEGDELWETDDAALLERAQRELAVLGFMNGAGAVDGTVVRQRKAYPVYDHEYRANVARVRRFVEAEVPNLQLAGRNGMHKYNNQDHAMMTGLIAARNILGGGADAWRVNTDAEYLEAESEDAGVRMTPMPAAAPATRRLLG